VRPEGMQASVLSALLLFSIPCGIFQTLTTQYASEICPIQLRHHLTAYINMCRGIGEFCGGATCATASD
jgi:SP family general alpha glucoside:H+ symporter-like MFS transporter